MKVSKNVQKNFHVSALIAKIMGTVDKTLEDELLSFIEREHPKTASRLKQRFHRSSRCEVQRSGSDE